MPVSESSGVPQYSTAISDAVLCLISVAMAWEVFASNYLCAAVGFLLVASAAGAGVVRFGLARPSTVIIDRHRYLSWQAGAAGVPLVAGSYLHHYSPPAAGLLVLIAVAVVVLRDRILSSNLCENAGDVLGPVAVVAVLVIGCLTFNGFAIVGTVLFAVAGLVVKTEGHISIFRRVDIFHFVLTAANIALMKGLILYDLPPVYYRP